MMPLIWMLIEPCRQWHVLIIKQIPLLLFNKWQHQHQQQKNDCWLDKFFTLANFILEFFFFFFRQFFFLSRALVWFSTENCRCAKWNEVKLKFYSYTPPACVRLYWRIHWISYLKMPKGNCIAVSNNASTNNNVIVHFYLKRIFSSLSTLRHFIPRHFLRWVRRLFSGIIFGFVAKVGFACTAQLCIETKRE